MPRNCFVIFIFVKFFVFAVGFRILNRLDRGPAKLIWFLRNCNFQALRYKLLNGMYCRRVQGFGDLITLSKMALLTTSIPPKMPLTTFVVQQGLFSKTIKNVCPSFYIVVLHLDIISFVVGLDTKENMLCAFAYCICYYACHC